MKSSNSKQRRSVGVFLEVGRAAMRKVVSGVMTFAHQRGNWNVFLPESHSGSSLESMLEGSWDGVIVGFDDSHGPDLLRLSVPLIGVGGGYGWFRPEMSIPYVGTDNTAVAQLAADHLLERGFVHFAYCGYNPTPVNGCCHRRQEAFSEAVSRAGYSCAIHNAPDTTTETWEKLSAELAQWLISLPRPLGLMTCNDARALQIIEACRMVGLRVPEDVAVVGVDNEEAICPFTDPPLTSVDQGAHQTGYEAASLLDQWMDGEPVAPGQRSVSPVGIVARGSTEILAVDDRDVTAALRYIREHACGQIGLDDVSRAIDSTNATLRRRFKAVLGRTVHQEIQRVRLERAKRLLVSTDWTFQKIARQCGFCSTQHMSTRVRQATGHTPRQYRQRYATPALQPAAGGSAR
ncbi:MAG: DNA-binding transcriptional regulator [Thermoguttaceae bacterium]|jgi:LacI family transcriptional regulator|nr:DNA-binding transcriptional regulator [Thermoguttaceae bacterium]